MAFCLRFDLFRLGLVPEHEFRERGQEKAKVGKKYYKLLIYVYYCIYPWLVLRRHKDTIPSIGVSRDTIGRSEKQNVNNPVVCDL